MTDLPDHYRPTVPSYTKRHPGQSINIVHNTHTVTASNSHTETSGAITSGTYFNPDSIHVYTESVGYQRFTFELNINGVGWVTIMDRMFECSETFVVSYTTGTGFASVDNYRYTIYNDNDTDRDVAIGLILLSEVV
jgi:hypothetical protein